MDDTPSSGGGAFDFGAFVSGLFGGGAAPAQASPVQAASAIEAPSQPQTPVATAPAPGTFPLSQPQTLAVNPSIGR